MLRSRLVVLTLTGALTATLAGWYGGPARADSPIETLSRVTVSNDAPAIGDTITISAVVLPAPPHQGVPTGAVTFYAASTEDGLWGADVDADLGTVPLIDGQAEVDLTLDEETMDSLDGAPDGFYVAAEYLGDEQQGTAYDPSRDSRHVDLADPDPGPEPEPDPVSTATTVTGPSSAVVGVATQLSATVSPANAVGAVQFSVDGSAVGAPVPVSAGSASLSHTFEHGGDHTVTAAFASSDPTEFTSSADSAGLTVSVDAVPTTTDITGPSTATVGTPSTLTATVAPTAAAGTVQFSVDGAPVGAPVSVAAGTAALSYTFPTGGEHAVGATFTPMDATTYAGSADGLALVLSPGPTTVEVTGPSGATAGKEVTLGAEVRPADVAGQVTFVVNGVHVATVDVAAGHAATAYTFTAGGTPTMTAFFTPTDSASYLSSTASGQAVVVQSGPAAITPPAPLATVPFVAPLAGSCAGSGPGAGQHRDLPGYFGPMTVTVKPLVEILMDILRMFLDLFRELFYKAFLCPHVDKAGRYHPARAVEGTLQCVLTDTGYQCPLDLPAFSELTVSGTLPMPAELAGQPVDLESTLSATDPETGAQTVVSSGVTTVHVPRRTVLSARLAPRPRYVTSVGHGRFVAYGITVRNEGIVRADHVRACVSVGRGARIALADNGGRIHGRTACWTLPVLKKGAVVNRTVHIRAPRSPGDLRVTAGVRPRKTQADRLHVTAVLPVR